MPAIAVTIAPDGWLTDVDLGDPDLRPVHLRRLIGCVAVHPIRLAADLLMWVADTADGRFAERRRDRHRHDHSEHSEPDHLRDRGLHRTFR